MKKLYTLKLILISALLTIAFNSCKKDSPFEIIDSQNENSILYFQNTKEYEEVKEKVCKYSLTELKKWEEENNFSSFGVRSWDKLIEANPENFPDIENLKLFVEKNSEYLQFIVGENKDDITLESVLFNDPNRFFINKDRLFQIENTVYKVLENALVSTSTENVSKLKFINEENCMNNTDQSIKVDLKSDFVYQTSDAQYNLGIEKNGTSTNGNDRIYLRIETSIYDATLATTFGFVSYRTMAGATYFMRPYHRVLGIWYFCTRTISGGMYFTIDASSNQGWIRNFSSKKEIQPVLDSKLEGRVLAYTVMPYYFTDIYSAHFAAYDCYATTPSVSRVRLVENEGSGLLKKKNQTHEKTNYPFTTFHPLFINRSRFLY